MKAIINEIGIIDFNNVKHPLYLKSGLNVITGKSSTGKSAIIEIFDYCFASNENTIPKGVITDSAVLYYLCITIQDTCVLLARESNNSTKAFLKTIEKYDKDIITRDLFLKKYFISLNDYKKELRSYFLDIEDVDESLEIKEKRGKKAPTPSIRSFTSFMLQHQNLIANKHALFYRFDEKEKKEQVINHTKIFLGFADQNYFYLCQEKERYESEIAKINREKTNNQKAIDSQKEKIRPLLDELYVLAGIKEKIISADTVIRTPQLAKDNLDKLFIPQNIQYLSDDFVTYQKELENKRDVLASELRKNQRKINTLEKNINSYSSVIENIKSKTILNNKNISISVCPFCHTESSSLTEESNRLSEAITKLSQDLKGNRSKSILEDALLEAKRSKENISSQLEYTINQIKEAETHNDEIKKNRSLYETILIQKAKLFAIIDILSGVDNSDLEGQIHNLQDKISDIERELDKYDIENQMNDALLKINKYMNEIGQKLDFEESYKPINLQFSFETFELYHKTANGEKVYLRSMGSGANWLYSHISLFLALHKYFAELGNKCSIPSILFIDQPTQVYFPNFKRDNSSSFNEQKKKEQELRLDTENTLEDDLSSVEKLFTLLADYCKTIEEKIGYCPQIIVTDHADDITLNNNMNFESFVNGNRWRTRGFIEPIPVKKDINL